MATANLAANILTVLSLFCGFASMIFSLEGRFTPACWAIILSVILDGLDGQVARRNPLSGEFGKQLDSLVDVVSFGIAPALLVYIFVYRAFYFWGAAALFIYLACSVIRLVKYNITPKTEMPGYFSGLPTTACGGTLASLMLVYRGYVIPAPRILFSLLVTALAVLMVSGIRYLNLDGLKGFLRSSPQAVATIVIVLIAVLIVFSRAVHLFVPEVAVLTLFVLYLFSPFFIRKLV